MFDADGMTRRKFNSLLLCAGAAVTLPSVNASSAPSSPIAREQYGFLHPGMLHGRSDLARMRRGVLEKKQPILAGFEALASHPLSQLTYASAGAFPEIGRNPNIRFQEFDRDANAAYQCALMWCITGDPAYGKVSSGILNAWAKTLRAISGADAVLCAALGGFKMANAAELMRHTGSSWTEGDASVFGGMLREVFAPVIENFAPYANGNWDTAATKMMMAIAIYHDDRPLFERALRYYRFGCGDGQLAHYIYANGQCQESGRDQQHTQLGLAHMGDCCEMAWHQGLDLYGSLDNRLLLGFEYTARYNLGGDVPFDPDIDQTGKYRHGVISARDSLRPVYEQIYNHYVHRRGITAPWTQRAAEKVRPEGAAFGADHTGFGTLLYSREPGVDIAEAALSAVPSGLYAQANGGAIELDFVPLTRVAHYTISRAVKNSAAFVVVAENSAGPTYRDTSVRPSQLYTYRVSAAAAPRKSMPAVEMAGLPSGWSQSSIGPLPGKNIASFDGTIYRLLAGGTKQPTPFSAFAAHCEMPAKCRFTARVLPLIASQFLQLGVAVLTGEREVTVDAMLSLSPRGESERPEWSASLLRTGGDGASAQEIHALPLSAPTIAYGRLVKSIWLRLERDGTALRATISADGRSWSEVGGTAVSNGALRVGLVLNSGLDMVTTTVCFDQVSVAAN